MISAKQMRKGGVGGKKPTTTKPKLCLSFLALNNLNKDN